MKAGYPGMRMILFTALLASCKNTSNLASDEGSRNDVVDNAKQESLSKLKKNTVLAIGLRYEENVKNKVGGKGFLSTGSKSLKTEWGQAQIAIGNLKYSPDYKLGTIRIIRSVNYPVIKESDLLHFEGESNTTLYLTLAIGNVGSGDGQLFILSKVKIDPGPFNVKIPILETINKFEANTTLSDMLQ